MFCTPRLIFGGTEGVGSRSHVLRSRTCFRRYRGRQVSFSCFALPNIFSAIPRVSGPFFMFLRSRTCLRLYRGRRVPLSCFALPNSFSAVLWVSGPVFMFCATGLIFGGTEGVGFVFHVLLSLTHFRRYRWPRVPFECFALPDSFSAVPRASGPVFMFCAPRLIFGGIGGVQSRFHVLRARTNF
jgi:hypothetical protein